MSKTISALAISLALAAPAFAQTATAPDAAAPAADAAAPAAAAPADAAAAPAADAAAPAAAPADAAAAGDMSGTYAFDPAHSQIVFEYDHLGFSTSHGIVNGVTGTVMLDQANPANSSVQAQFPLSAMVTIAQQLDDHLLSADFFNAAGDTQVTFKSTSVEPDGDDEAKVTGDLTMNGITKPITLDVEVNKAGPHPMGGKPTVGFHIEGKLLRSDFNLGAMAPAIEDEIEFDIAVEASKG